MITTQRMMGFKPANTGVMPIINTTTTFYLNVFKDKEGKICYSNDQFPVGKNGIFNLHSAIADAYRHTIINDWTYVTTLTNSTDNAERDVANALIFLEQMASEIKEAGKDITNYRMEELEEIVQHVREETARKGGRNG